MLWIITGIIISYLVGSLPTAYLFGRLLKGIDIRKHGSGNVGATNALRVLGRGPGLTVLLLDVLKGFMPVFFLGNILSSKAAFISNEALLIILGISCICGHNWTVFLNFKGGKGVATTLGVLIALSAKIAGLKLVLFLLILTWLLVFFVSRIVSFASVTVAAALPIYSILFKQSRLIVFSSLLFSIFVILRHRTNIKRIIDGKEKQASFKKSA